MTTVIESGDLIKKKKKRKPTDVDAPKKKKKKSLDSEDKPKKKKKKLLDEDKPKKKKKKSLDSEGKPKKKKKSTVPASSRDRESILKAKAKLKPQKKSVPKTVNEVEYDEPSVDESQLSKQFDELYGNHVGTLSVEDQEQMQEYFLMFHKLRNIARRFEVKAQHGSSKDVYALMKIYDQMREIIADLKALKDISMVADKLQQDVLIPYSKIMISEMSNMRASILKTAMRLLPAEAQSTFQEALDSQLIASSQQLEEGFHNARTAILDIYAE